MNRKFPIRLLKVVYYSEKVRIAFSWKFLLSLFHIAGCRTSTLFVEQWAYCEFNCSKPECYITNYLWGIGEQYFNSLEPSSSWSDCQCSENVLGNGCRSVWRVPKAACRERGKGQRGGRTAGDDMEKTGRCSRWGYDYSLNDQPRFPCTCRHWKVNGRKMTTSLPHLSFWWYSFLIFFFAF